VVEPDGTFTSRDAQTERVSPLGGGALAVTFAVVTVDAQIIEIDCGKHDPVNVRVAYTPPRRKCGSCQSSKTPG